jgi:hypothetical protein
MNIPKVKIKVASLDEIFPIIHSFLNPAEDELQWSDTIYKYYPGLKEKLKNIKNKDQRKDTEHNFFKKVLGEKKNELEEKAKDFRKEWDKINDDIMVALSNLTEHEWSEKDKQIIARISLNSICPRYLKERIFDLFYKDNIKDMKSFAIHEISHFIYFEKWKTIFNNTDEKDFEPPTLIWKLSEMMPGVILNDQKIQKVFKYKFESYPEYEKIKLNDKPILAYLQNFYNNRKDFIDFLKKSWVFVNKYQKAIFSR